MLVKVRHMNILRNNMQKMAFAWQGRNDDANFIPYPSKRGYFLWTIAECNAHAIV